MLKWLHSHKNWKGKTINPIIAVIDANILYKASLRDLFMNLIASGAFQGKWSADIHREWTTNLIANGQNKEKVLRTKKLMDENFPDATVKRYKSLINGLTLPDVDDRHVLAAAIKAGATHIATDNMKDFPKKNLPANMHAIRPDDFLALLSTVTPLQVLRE